MTQKNPLFFEDRDHMSACYTWSLLAINEYGIRLFHEPSEDETRIASDSKKRVNIEDCTDSKIVNIKEGFEAAIKNFKKRGNIHEGMKLLTTLHKMADAHAEKHGKVSKPDPRRIEALAEEAYYRGIMPILIAREDHDEEGLHRAINQSEAVEVKLRKDVQTLKAGIREPEMKGTLDDIVLAYRVSKDIATSTKIAFASNEQPCEMIDRLMGKYRQAEENRGLG